MIITDLDADTDFLCGSTSATYSPANKRRNQNIAYNDIARIIWNSSNGWQYDDSNATTLPIAKTSLVQNQQDYTLPTDAQRVWEVNVKDNGGTWHQLQQRDWSDMEVAPAQFATGGGLPLYYDIVGRSVMLYPAALSTNVTLSAGLAFYVERNITDIAVSATTSEPGFAKPFHRLLSYAAAIDFIQDPQRLQFLTAQRDRLQQGMTEFYAFRNIEGPATIRPKGKTHWRQYM